LYSRKILIKKDCRDILIPNYLRFVKGIVDCEDLPLNISRENYQDSALIAKLKNVITKRIIKHLKDEAEKDPEAYNKWYQDFQFFIK
jgi:TNF receptor-associated protein 1